MHPHMVRLVKWTQKNISASHLTLAPSPGEADQAMLKPPRTRLGEGRAVRGLSALRAPRLPIKGEH